MISAELRLKFLSSDTLDSPISGTHIVVPAGSYVRGSPVVGSPPDDSLPVILRPFSRPRRGCVHRRLCLPPVKYAEAWKADLAKNARLRKAYQDQQAAGLMTLDELASRLKELDAARRMAEAEIAAVRRSEKRAEELEKDRDAVLTSLATSIPEALERLS